MSLSSLQRVDILSLFTELKKRGNRKHLNHYANIMYMCANLSLSQERVSTKKLNSELLDAVGIFSSYVSRVNFLGEFVIVYFSSEPKKDAEKLQISISEKVSDMLCMEFQFFRGVGREWWFRRA